MYMWKHFVYTLTDSGKIIVLQVLVWFLIVYCFYIFVVFFTICSLIVLYYDGVSTYKFIMGSQL